MIDKKMFYERFQGFENKYVPIDINMPLCNGSAYRIVYYWASRLPDGKFNPIMNCSLIDTERQGLEQYIAPDLVFDCIKENVTTDFRLYRFLDKWVTEAVLAHEKRRKIENERR